MPYTQGNRKIEASGLQRLERGDWGLKNMALYRIVIIVKMMLKFFFQLTLFQRRYQNRREEADVQSKFEQLLQKQASEYRETALRLEGLLIKLGQFLSSRADILPKVFLNELESLVDRVPPVSWEQAKHVLDEEWGDNYEEILHKISIEPIASASIGEVYHGYLHNGDSVAVKIRRPGIEKIIKTDFKAIRIVLWFAKHFTSYGKQFNLPQLYREMKAVISDELDFKKELKNGVYFQRRYEDFDDVHIPSYYRDYSTKRVLVMEWIEGAKVTDTPFLSLHGINREALAERLLKVFLEQLLQEGKFHADPHQGNLLVEADGTVVLIDFGMVGEIKKQDTVSIRRLVEGIIIDDYDKVIDALQDLRFLLPHANKERLKEVLANLVELYAEQGASQLDEEGIEQLLIDIQSLVKEEPIQFPSEFAFFGRAISTFVGILYSVNPTIKILDVSKPLIMEWLENHQEAGASSIPKMLREYMTPLLRLPNRLEQALMEPAKQREWEYEKEKQKQTISYRQGRSRDAFIVALTSLIGLYIGIWMHQKPMIYLSGGLAFFSLVFYIRSLVLYRRLINTFHRKGD